LVAIVNLPFGKVASGSQRNAPFFSGHEHKYDDVRGKEFFGQTRREVLPHGAAYPEVDL